MGKKKNAKSDQPTRSSSRPKQPKKPSEAEAEAVDIPDDSDTGEKDEKERAGTISWADNPGWVTKAVNYLIDNSSFRIKLFSDSTEDATNDGRKRIVGKESKINMYGTLAHEIFKELPKDAPPEDTEDDVVSAEVRAAYKDNPIRFAKSLQQQFARLKKSYSAHKKTLVQTGGGLKPEDQQNNLIEKIKLAFPHWDELDGFWRELPNYKPHRCQQFYRRCRPRCSCRISVPQEGRVRRYQWNRRRPGYPDSI
ncbi:hypothetical protein B0H14DRAFT_1017237 [Mycena olivaceomarginata]|nr:hypothetical protein B0H14DRAFT_1017237 [Mycena olivaceomarginata]